MGAGGTAKSDVGAEAHNAPGVTAAGVWLAQLEDIVKAEVDDVAHPAPRIKPAACSAALEAASAKSEPAEAYRMSRDMVMRAFSP